MDGTACKSIIHDTVLQNEIEYHNIENSNLAYMYNYTFTVSWHDILNA